MTTANLKAGVTGSARNWKGVIRENGKIVWTCEHVHRNREQYTVQYGKSAKTCATTELGMRHCCFCATGDDDHVCAEFLSAGTRVSK